MTSTTESTKATTTSFWRSVPGILTGIAGTLTAATGLIAALNQGGVLDRQAPIDVAGRWTANVTYAWGATYREQFVFQVDGERVFGTATFLGVPRAVESGSIRDERLSFVVRAEELLGSDTREFELRYDAALTRGALHVVLEDTRGNPPIQFAASRQVQ